MYYSSYFLHIIMSRMVSKNLTSLKLLICKISTDTSYRELFALKVITLATSTRLGMKGIYIKKVISICQPFSVQ